MNIHNLIEIDIDTNFPQRDALLDSISDVLSVTQTRSTTAKAHLRMLYDRALSTAGMREISAGIHGNSRGMFDRKYRVILESPEENVLTLRTDNLCLEWFSWALQLALLRAGVTFVHCAAVEKDGRAVLFPSWGGVGKTALVAGLVRSDGWRLLGDDFGVLSPDGALYGYPRPMVVYPYHRGVFPELFSDGRKPLVSASLNGWMTLAARTVKPMLRPFPGLLSFARRHNPQSITVRPSEVFGFEQLASNARVEKVIWLERVLDLDKPELVPDDGSIDSRILGSTLCQFDPHCVSATNIAMGLGIMDANELYGRWIDILTTGLARVTPLTLRLPAALPVGEIAGVVREILSRNEKIEAAA